MHKKQIPISPPSSSNVVRRVPPLCFPFRSRLFFPLVALCLVVSTAAGQVVDSEDTFEGPEHANENAFEGGATGTDADTSEEVNESNLKGHGKFDIPTGAKPSRLFGAKPWTQQMYRFEEFGPEPLPERPGVGPGDSFPAPPDAQSGPDQAALNEFLLQGIYPFPTQFANDTDSNPWQPEIQDFLGRPLDDPPAEGRPPGEDWAHQRWDEFYPEVYFQTAQVGSRVNEGLRDEKQMHGYGVGEFAPGGLYHNTMSGVEGFDGTANGIPVAFHPNFPHQEPNALWTFDGTFPPKLLMARYGESILMRHYNALPINPAANFGFGLHTITTHEHNGHNPAESDGYAQAFFFPGQFYDYRWPMVLAGHDSINPDKTDIRAGAPDGSGGIRMIPGNWRETMSTHWFHDHMLDYTAQNVYKGNVAMMNYYSALDRGKEDLEDGVNLRLPSGTALDWGNRDYDVQLVIADKAWDRDGQLFFNIFNTDGFLGDQILVNWNWKPYFNVRARQYRFRILNGSVSRYLRLALVDENDTAVPFYMIANDGNIMEHAVYFPDGELPTQAIAERYDIIVDFSRFSAGDKIFMVNLLEHRNGKRPHEAIPLEDVLSGEYKARRRNNEWKDGDPGVGKFLQFIVQGYDETDYSMDPSEYVAVLPDGTPGMKMIPLPEFTREELDNATHRTFEFGRSSGTDKAPWTIKTDGGSGLGMDPRRLSAAPTKGNVEIWHLENGGGGWSHPIHIHFEEGQILKRGGEDPPEWEWWARKDVYRIGRMDDSLDSVELAIRFREFGGTFMEHCHNTQHEDHAMLLRWDIINEGEAMGLVPMATPMPSWDGIGYVDSRALPTAISGDLDTYAQWLETEFIDVSDPPTITADPPTITADPPTITAEQWRFSDKKDRIRFRGFLDKPLDENGTPLTLHVVFWNGGEFFDREEDLEIIDGMGEYQVRSRDEVDVSDVDTVEMYATNSDGALVTSRSWERDDVD